MSTTTQHPYFISITSSEKNRLYAPWQQAVITKLVCKRVGFKFLRNKLKSPYNLNEDLHVIDLGDDYYLIKFTNTENYVKVMHKGPWFIGSENGNLNSTPHKTQLPSPQSGSHYQNYQRNSTILRKIDSQIGSILKIDSCTRNTSRGRNARLCVLVQLGKPVPEDLLIGKHLQKYIMRSQHIYARVVDAWDIHSITV